MRPVLATSEIGDGVSMAVLNGIVAGMGRQRAYDPLNPTDIGAVGPEATPRFNPFSGPDCQVITQALEFTLPMTMHQRLYQWPEAGVGPINSPTGVTVALPPKEIQAGQADFALPTIPLFAIEAPLPERPRIGLNTETVIPPRGGQLRAQWTVYQTAPWMVAPPSPKLGGDSKVFRITGVAYNNDGSTPVANCRVVAFDAGSVGFGKSAIVVAETVSDGSGNYALDVTSRFVQIQAYKAGTPNLVGATRADLIEGTVPIYLRDPAASDPTPASIAAAVWNATGRTLT
jgi:hypothetical protein